jgi:hypothetical protein
LFSLSGGFLTTFFSLLFPLSFRHSVAPHTTLLLVLIPRNNRFLIFNRNSIHFEEIEDTKKFFKWTETKLEIFTSLFQILCLFRGVIFSADSGRTPRSAPDANVVFPAYILDIFSYLAGIL